MSACHTALDTPALPDAVAAAVGDALNPAFRELRAFVDRRIAELSAEVSATVQLMGLSEDNLTGQIGRIHEQIAGLVAVPAASARNSGVELEAVVQATEQAANTIMEAAEAIQSWIDDGAQAEGVRSLSERINAIFEACSFQDVTGQRIRRAIQHLQQVETMLEGLMPERPQKDRPDRMTVVTQQHTVSAEAQAAPDLAQAEIDKLLDF